MLLYLEIMQYLYLCCNCLIAEGRITEPPSKQFDKPTPWQILESNRLPATPPPLDSRLWLRVGFCDGSVPLGAQGPSSGKIM